MKKTTIACALAISVLGGISAHAADSTTSRSLSFAQAKQIEAKAEATIMNHKLGGVIAIVDASGQLILLDRLDGALLANLELAQKKAHTAVAFDAPTQDWVDKLAQGNTGILGNPEVVPLPGGMPIKIDGVLVGAIGVATPQGSVDAEAAKGAVAGL